MQGLEHAPPPAGASHAHRTSDEQVEETWWHSSGPMSDVAQLIDRVADCDVIVLIQGESGVGKELVARAIHRRSPRARRPLVRTNCAALPAELLESELFGHERGAFTGATSVRVGMFEQAHHGTILLDEIGELPAGLQAKLLHVLHDGSFTRLGSNRPVVADARVLAATNRDLGAMIASGQFREDLYYRLNVVEIHVPPLRERQEELAALVPHFLGQFSAKYNRPVPTIPDDLTRLLLEYLVAGQRARTRELHEAARVAPGSRPDRAGPSDIATRRRRDSAIRGTGFAGASDRGACTRGRAEGLQRSRLGAERGGVRRSASGGTRREIAAGCRARGVGTRGTDCDSAHACGRSLEQAPRGGPSRGELQDSSQQDQGSGR